MRYALVCVVLFIASPAAALCGGESFESELAQADLVVRARAVEETRAHHDEPVPSSTKRRWGEYLPAMTYRLEVVDRFKGEPPIDLKIFQQVDSGRFELDLGDDYLLFLFRYASTNGQPQEQVGAYYVRYACGQSKSWGELTAAVRTKLLRLR